MRNQIYLVFITVFILGTFQNCSQGFKVVGSSDSESSQTKTSVPTEKTEGDVTSFSYFHGGWFGLRPNFEYDTVFDLNEKTIHIKYINDSGAIEQFVSLTDEEVADLQELLSGIQTKIYDGPLLLDRGSESVTVHYKDNTSLRAYLVVGDTRVGVQEVASDKEGLRQHIQGLILDKLAELNPLYCPAEEAIVCGDDQKTYLNSCIAESLGASVEYEGACRHICPANYDPVCGSDGNTYTNSCNAISRGVNVVYRGSCKSRVQQDIVRVHYFNGGWFGPSPNWSHDYEIDLAAGSIKAKTVGSRCGRSGAIESEDSSELSRLISLLDLRPKLASDPQLIDAGFETLAIEYRDGSRVLIHLKLGSAALGHLVATNPEALSKLLGKIDSQLRVQSECVSPL